MTILARSRIRILAALLVLALISPALAACGRKGPPEPPEGSTYPRQYPDPAEL